MKTRRPQRKISLSFRAVARQSSAIRNDQPDCRVTLFLAMTYQFFLCGLRGKKYLKLISKA